MSNLHSKLICLFILKYCLKPNALSSPGTRDDNGPPGKSVNHKEKAVKVCWRALRKWKSSITHAALESRCWVLKRQVFHGNMRKCYGTQDVFFPQVQMELIIEVNNQQRCECQGRDDGQCIVNDWQSQKHPIAPLHCLFHCLCDDFTHSGHRVWVIASCLVSVQSL